MDIEPKQEGTIITKHYSECTLSDQELADICDQEITNLCRSGGNSFVMRVPADYNRDTDLLLSEIVQRFRKKMTLQDINDISDDEVKAHIKSNPNLSDRYGTAFRLIQWYKAKLFNSDKEG